MNTEHTWLILGATSSMARAFTRAVAKRGHSVILAGRDLDDLEASAADAEAHGAPVAGAIPFDARDAASFETLVAGLEDLLDTLNCAVFVGSMPAQEDIDADPSLITGTVTDNFTGPAELLQRLAPLMEKRGAGTVVGVGSVAGDRGRVGNYVYGAAKAGFHTYLSGLRNRLNRSGCHVLTVKPGFVDTAMTYDIDGMFLVATPDKVAADILRACDKRKNTLYTPFFWRYIMRIIKSIPEPIFKKLSI